MKRTAGMLVVLAAVGGCVHTGNDEVYQAGTKGSMGPIPPTLPNAVGPWGQPVTAMPSVGPHAPGAMAGVGPEVPFPNPMLGGAPGRMMPGGMPPGMLPMGPAPMAPGGAPGPMMGAGNMPGMPGGPIAPASHVPLGPAGVMQAGGFGGPGGGALAPQAPSRTQIRFDQPAGAKIGWYVADGVGPTGKMLMRPHQLDVPGRYNFIQASIYRVKLSDIPGRPGLELYPSIEVVPANAKTEAFLAHNFVPVTFTNEDLDQIVAGNYLTKVIYLPDAQYQGPTATMPDEIVSTRLDPGVNPIDEAVKRGHILAVVRVGGIDLEAANTPGLENQGPYGAPKSPSDAAASGHGMMPMPNVMPPYLQSQQRPQLPGQAAAVPSGMPGVPPTVTPPGAPTARVPTPPPIGPMVPAAPGTLPPMPVLGDAATYRPDVDQDGVKQTAYAIGADGKRRPFTLQSRKESNMPLTSIPPSDGSQRPPAVPEMNEDEQARQPVKPVPPSAQKPVKRGLIDRWFGSN